MVKNQVHSSQSGTFDISAAMLHIIAMTFMLHDHLWATLLPAQDWLNLRRKARVSHLWHLWRGRIFSHAQL